MKQEKNSNWSKAKLFVEKNCVNLQEKENMGVETECKSRFVLLNRSPSSDALIDVLESWSICGRRGTPLLQYISLAHSISGCESILGSMSNKLIGITIAFIILWFLLVTLCGLYIKVMGNNSAARLYDGFGGYPSSPPPSLNAKTYQYSLPFSPKESNESNASNALTRFFQSKKSD